jgi:hypothetical protein
VQSVEDLGVEQPNREGALEALGPRRTPKFWEIFLRSKLRVALANWATVASRSRSLRKTPKSLGRNEMLAEQNEI